MSNNDKNEQAEVHCKCMLDGFKVRIEEEKFKPSINLFLFDILKLIGNLQERVKELEEKRR